jgi:hypothetical protein
VSACGEFFTAVLPDEYQIKQATSVKQEENIK